MQTPIDLIALDLDGTLLAPDETISPRNRAAIAAALAAGIRVVLVTGRGVDMPIRVSHELRLNLPVICCHGALTKDFGAHRTLVHIPVPLVYAKPMLELAEREHLAVAAYVNEAFYRLAGTPVLMDDMRGPGWHEVGSLAEILTDAPTFIRFLGAEAVRRMEEVFGDLPLSFRYETWHEFVECAVLSREASKRNALAQLCAGFQIPAERVMAIGDSRNDVPMMRWAKIGVAMGNSLPEVRHAVRYVTARNDQDGVALAIERFCLPAKQKLA
jgi:Cof subfamily protein (haloacid dehalogenase superfamily)